MPDAVGVEDLEHFGADADVGQLGGEGRGVDQHAAGRAGLGDLAAQVAASLAPSGRTRVRLRLDLSYAPGPRFKEILSAIEDAQLEGRIATHAAALEWLAREFPL